jgi:glycosyltransferase involved in cell wall biosynthesis
MAAGTSVVSFDLPATRELLGGCGRLAALGDEESLASQLDKALSTPGENSQLARMRCENVYSIDSIVQRHLEIYGVAR